MILPKDISLFGAAYPPTDFLRLQPNKGWLEARYSEKAEPYFLDPIARCVK